MKTIDQSTAIVQFHNFKVQFYLELYPLFIEYLKAWDGKQVRTKTGNKTAKFEKFLAAFNLEDKIKNLSRYPKNANKALHRLSFRPEYNTCFLNISLWINKGDNKGCYQEFTSSVGGLQNPNGYTAGESEDYTTVSKEMKNLNKVRKLAEELNLLSRECRLIDSIFVTPKEV